MRAALQAIAFLLCTSLTAAADAPGRALALSVLRGPTTAFTGVQRSVVTLDGGGKAQVDVAVHCDGKGSVRRDYLSGLARGIVMVERAGGMWQRSVLGIWSRIPAAPRLDASTAATLLAQGYRVSMLSAEPILGRATIAVAFQPRRPFCPSRRVWLDPVTRIPLRDEIRAPDGTLRSSSEYVSLAIAPQPASVFAAPAVAPPAGPPGPGTFSARASAAAVERETGRKVWLPAYVPPGFRLAGYGVVVTRMGSLMPVVRYSDGLAAFTVFQRGPAPGMGAMGRAHWSGPVAAAEVGDTARSAAQESTATRFGKRSGYMLVGDISADELRHVASSLP